MTCKAKCKEAQRKSANQIVSPEIPQEIQNFCAIFTRPPLSSRSVEGGSGYETKDSI